MDKDRLHLGLDVGSVSAKTVLIDEDMNVVEEHYTRTKGQPLDTVLRVLTEILTRVQSGYRNSLEPRLELWSVLHWRTMRAIGYKGGRHVNYEGKEYNVPGDMAEI